MIHLTSSTSSSVTTKSEKVEKAREIVRRLGKLKLQDLAGQDGEAQAHAKEHNEDIVVPQEIKDKRALQSLEEGMEELGRTARKTVLHADQPSDASEELEKCRNELRESLQSEGLSHQML